MLGAGAELGTYGITASGTYDFMVYHMFYPQVRQTKRAASDNRAIGRQAGSSRRRSPS